LFWPGSRDWLSGGFHRCIFFREYRIGGHADNIDQSRRGELSECCGQTQSGFDGQYDDQKKPDRAGIRRTPAWVPSLPEIHRCNMIAQSN
jgi:hypothetical protein